VYILTHTQLYSYPNITPPSYFTQLNGHAGQISDTNSLSHCSFSPEEKGFSLPMSRPPLRACKATKDDRKLSAPITKNFRGRDPGEGHKTASILQQHMHWTFLKFGHALSMLCPCLVHALSMPCPCLVHALSMPYVCE
jgi:hypothetical protein